MSKSYHKVCKHCGRAFISDLDIKQHCSLHCWQQENLNTKPRKKQSRPPYTRKEDKEINVKKVTDALTFSQITKLCAKYKCTYGKLVALIESGKIDVSKEK